MSPMSVTCRAFGARTLPAIVKAGERVCWEHSRRSSPPGKYRVDGIVTAGRQPGRQSGCVLSALRFFTRIRHVFYV